MSATASSHTAAPITSGPISTVLTALDPRIPPIELLHLIGPDGERTAPAPPALTLDQSLAYCRALATTHYENFSVLSRLVPVHLRDDFAAVYAFCRWADDLGDETGNTPEARARSERLLAWWRAELHNCFSAPSAPSDPSASAHTPSHPVYIALRETARRHPHLRPKPFEDLIDAFVQDQRIGMEGNRYKTWDQVLDYCARSANPVGRIVLTLGGHAPPDVDPSNAERYAMSDATCTALQLINFWQDVRRDLLERDRIYIPELGPGGHPTGITPELLRAWIKTPNDPRARVPYIKGLRPLVDATADLFDHGRPLPQTLNKGLQPVVWLFGAGGEAILRAVRTMGCATLWHRPRLAASEKAWLVARAWMKSSVAGK